MADERKILIIVSNNKDEVQLYSLLKELHVTELLCCTEILLIENYLGIEDFELSTINLNNRVDIPIESLKIPFSKGYGSNQKIGYQYAIAKGFEAVVQVDCYDQYIFKMLPDLVKVVLSGDADGCFGSRLKAMDSAFNSYMTVKTYILQRFLAVCQNRLLNLHLTNYNPECRIYSVNALKQLPFRYNTDGVLFDIEIIIQLALKGLAIKEISINNHISKDVCQAKGFADVFNSIVTAMTSRMHLSGIFYKNKFDIQRDNVNYEAKFNYISSHTMALNAIPDRVKVLDLACGSGFLAKELKKRKCRVTGIDMKPANMENFTKFILLNLDLGKLPEKLGQYNYILALDCLEHLKNPEMFLAELREKCFSSKINIICTTANIAFFPIRIGLLLGTFNYGRFGILDFTHKRLFTFKSFKQMFIQEGYVVTKIRGIPAPYPKALGYNILSRALLNLNKLLVRIAPTLFAYQIYIEAKMRPPLKNIAGLIGR
ncbi:class I SAM-dependent methyltransferase [Desulfococcaceae bacterium HSG9]|nr:class I SAM-dependent methyltransferase [Desulfococcaceae bacterium HSG9]